MKHESMTLHAREITLRVTWYFIDTGAKAIHILVENKINRVLMTRTRCELWQHRAMRPLYIRAWRTWAHVNTVTHAHIYFSGAFLTVIQCDVNLPDQKHQKRATLLYFGTYRTLCCSMCVSSATFESFSYLVQKLSTKWWFFGGQSFACGFVSLLNAGGGYTHQIFAGPWFTVFDAGFGELWGHVIPVQNDMYIYHNVQISSKPGF